MSQIVTALTGQCCIEERCSPLECQLAKHNPIPSIPFSAPYLHPPATCPGGKEWQDCGTLCPLTCDNYNFTLSCPDQCVPGCFCPKGTVDFNGVCVDPSICPGRSIVPSLTSSMSSLTFFPLHLQYQNPLYFQDLASEWLEKKRAEESALLFCQTLLPFIHSHHVYLSYVLLTLSIFSLGNGAPPVVTCPTAAPHMMSTISSFLDHNQVAQSMRTPPPSSLPGSVCSVITPASSPRMLQPVPPGSATAPCPTSVALKRSWTHYPLPRPTAP